MIKTKLNTIAVSRFNPSTQAGAALNEVAISIVLIALVAIPMVGTFSGSVVRIYCNPLLWQMFSPDGEDEIGPAEDISQGCVHVEEDESGGF